MVLTVLKQLGIYDAVTSLLPAQQATAIVNIVKALAEKNIKVVPDILVTGANGGGVEGLAATLMKYLGDKKTNS